VAYICTINNFVHPLAAKIVFCVCDIVMGYILWEIIEYQSEKNKGNTIYYVAFWICNPLIVCLSTRGSNDNMTTLILFAAIYFLLKK
jgi:GPI mannosyltransferase 1 subunit M